MMHELSAVEGMVETALAKAEQIGSPRVVGMHFVINAGGHVSEESVQVCFTIAAHGTSAEGAQLDFEWNPPHYRCFECGHEFDGRRDDENMLSCPHCQETAMLVPPVEEFYLDSIDVE
jgi:hydrogenase nickel incorporation protein HypA/HybF